MTPRNPVALALCLMIVRLFGWLVPSASRENWRREWEAEVRHRWHVLESRQHLDWRTKMDLVGRVLGALPDAAWLRRQFTADAEVVHDVRHGLRMLRKSPAIFRLRRVHTRARHRRYGFHREPARYADLQAAAVRERRSGGHGLAAACGAQPGARGRVPRKLPRLARAGAVVRSHRRRDSILVRLHRRGRAGSVLRSSGDDRVLGRAWRTTGPRPRILARGTRFRRPPCRDHQLRLVAAEIRRRPLDCQPRDQPRRGAVDRCRRAPAGLRAAADATTRRSVRVDSKGHSGPRKAHAWQCLVERRRSAEARCDRRPGASAKWIPSPSPSLANTRARTRA